MKVENWDIIRIVYNRYKGGTRTDELRQLYYTAFGLLLANGEDLTVLNNSGRGILGAIVVNNIPELASVVVQHRTGAELDHVTWNDNRKYALHMAIARGRNEIAQILLDAGASITLQDDNGATPVDIAANSNQEFYQANFA